MKERGQVYWPPQPHFFMPGTLSMWYIPVSWSPEQFWPCQKAPKNPGRNPFEDEPSIHPFMESGCSQHTAHYPGGKPGSLHLKDNPIFMTKLYQPSISSSLSGLTTRVGSLTVDSRLFHLKEVPWILGTPSLTSGQAACNGDLWQKWKPSTGWRLWLSSLFLLVYRVPGSMLKALMYQII